MILTEAAVSGVCIEQGRGSRTCIIGAIGPSGEYVNVLHEASVRGSKILDTISSSGFPLRSSFSMNDIVFYRSSIEWNRVRFRFLEQSTGRRNRSQVARYLRVWPLTREPGSGVQ